MTLITTLHQYYDKDSSITEDADTVNNITTAAITPIKALQQLQQHR